MESLHQMSNIPVDTTLDDADEMELKMSDIFDKMDEAEKRKQIGNTHFKNKEYKKAISFYHQALLHTKGVDADINPPYSATRAPKLDKEASGRLKDLTASLNSNLSACLLKQSPVPYERVVQLCRHSVELQPGNAKAWFRLATAQLALNEADNADHSIKMANKLTHGKDSSIRKLTSEIDAAVEKEKQSFNKLFKDKLINFSA